PFFLSMRTPPPISSLFPYTTLFRSIRLINPDRREREEVAMPFLGSFQFLVCPLLLREVDVDCKDSDRLRVDENGNTENLDWEQEDRKSTRLNSSHVSISYAVFCLKK